MTTIFSTIFDAFCGLIFCSWSRNVRSKTRNIRLTKGSRNHWRKQKIIAIYVAENIVADRNVNCTIRHVNLIHYIWRKKRVLIGCVHFRREIFLSCFMHILYISTCCIQVRTTYLDKQSLVFIQLFVFNYLITFHIMF